MFGLFRRDGSPPARFVDPCLHFAVLQAAWDARLLPQFDVAKHYRDVVGQPWSAEREGAAVDPRVHDALVATPIPARVAARIEQLHWDGGMEIQHMVFHYWDGEDSIFDIRSLQGIEALTGLRTLSLSVARLTDAAPLVPLRKLRTFTLGVGEFQMIVRNNRSDAIQPEVDACIADLSPLLKLPALRALRIGGHYLPTEANRKVLETLAARGVYAPTREEAIAQADKRLGLG
jgi:hypothetical protein